MATTYNVSITSKAIKSFQQLNTRLLANHPLAERSDIRIITMYLHSSHGHWLYPDEMQNRYIRIVIDIPKGRLQNAEQKHALLQKTTEACLEYQGKKAVECEVEVRINEFNDEEFMRVLPRRVHT